MTDEQNKQAQDLFKVNLTLEKVWINPKGEFFTNQSLGENSLNEGEKLKVVCRNTTPTIKDASAKELIELVKNKNVVAELEQLILEEIEEKNRKTVIDAIEKRIEELKTAQDNG